MASFGAMQGHQDQYSDESRDTDVGSRRQENYGGAYPGEDREVLETSRARRRRKEERSPFGYQPAGEDAKEVPVALTPESTMDTATKAKVDAFAKFVDDSHRSMSYHYAEARVGDARRLGDQPQELHASCVDEEIPALSGVFIVNQKKHSTVQKNVFRRDAIQQKKLLAAGLEYFRGLAGLDFSEVTNPDVHKEKSSLWIGKEAKLSPFVLWDKETTSATSSMRVDSAIGFPSVNKMTNHRTGDTVNDTVVESGFMVTAMNPMGIRIHGVYGGKEGKMLEPGQALFYGEAMIHSNGNFMRPVWVRLVSTAPSIKVDGGVSVATMSAKMIPLNPGAVASELKEYVGTAKRTVRISNIMEGSAKKGGKSIVKSRVVCATLSFDFKGK